MPHRNIVVLGASGMLGRAICRDLRRRGQSFVAPSRAEVDLSAPTPRLDDALGPYLGGHRGGRLVDPVACLINCAAATDVDGAEHAESEALCVNGLAVGGLAEICRKRGALLVHFSTDYVFDGISDTAYAPSAQRRPLNAYGRSKALGEDLVVASGCEHLVVRTSWLYAPWGKNFVRTMLRLFAEERAVRVVSDQWGRPSSCHDVARFALDLLDLGRRGTEHVAGATVCTWYDFARAIHERAGRAAAPPRAWLEPCSTDEHPRVALRPRRAVLDVRGTERLLGPLPPLSDSLERVLQELLPSR